MNFMKKTALPSPLHLEKDMLGFSSVVFGGVSQ